MAPRAGKKILPLIASPTPVVRQSVPFFMRLPWVMLDPKSNGMPHNVEKTSMNTTFIRRLLNGVRS